VHKFTRCQIVKWGQQCKKRKKKNQKSTYDNEGPTKILSEMQKVQKSAKKCKKVQKSEKKGQKVRKYKKVLKIAKLSRCQNVK